MKKLILFVLLSVLNVVAFGDSVTTVNFANQFKGSEDIVRGNVIPCVKIIEDPMKTLPYYGYTKGRFDISNCGDEKKRGMNVAVSYAGTVQEGDPAPYNVYWMGFTFTEDPTVYIKEGDQCVKDDGLYSYRCLGIRVLGSTPDFHPPYYYGWEYHNIPTSITIILIDPHRTMENKT